MSLQRPITDSVIARARGLVPIGHLADVDRLQLLSVSTLVDYEEGEPVVSPGGAERMNAYLLDGVLGEPGQHVAQPAAHHAETSNSTLPLDLDDAALHPQRALCPSLVLWVPCRILERLLTASFSDTMPPGMESQTSARWVGKLLGSAPFNRLPPSVVRDVFARLENFPCTPGQFLVREGEPGSHYYLIAEGRCVVTREPLPGAPRQPLAVLGPGDAFGEEALLSGNPRNASVAMLGPGRVMRLPKPDFLALLRDTLLKDVGWEDAQTRVARGAACFVDVRGEQESRARPFAAARQMPLRSLRAQALKLDRRLDYIVCCEDGTRAAAGAFILASLGFHARVLVGGLCNIASERLAKPAGGLSRTGAQSRPALHATPIAGQGDGAEIARLRARIGELEAENARLRASAAGAETVQSRAHRTTDPRIGIAASRTIVQSSVSVPSAVEPPGARKA